ncbi:hypothetical protein ACROYT_G006730 [Oculina patagonica]
MDCRKRNVRPGEQIMAPLPEARIAPSDPPSTHVGVDYFGPLYVKQGRSEVKRYGYLFTCLTMRAVHIEVAHTLEADSFICAYQRFVCRRGKPRKIYSDNGTNFTGAERELREALGRLDQTKVYNHLRIGDVQWSFNPPEASHQGGIWERMIRSVRKILAALVKEQLMKDEALSTLLCEVEKILNDRPLTPLSDHPDDSEPLTPNKLLLIPAFPLMSSQNTTMHGEQEFECEDVLEGTEILSLPVETGFVQFARDLAATEENESGVLHVECGMECSLPGEQQESDSGT